MVEMQSSEVEGLKTRLPFLYQESAKHWKLAEKTEKLHQFVSCHRGISSRNLDKKKRSLCHFTPLMNVQLPDF